MDLARVSERGREHNCFRLSVRVVEGKSSLSDHSQCSSVPEECESDIRLIKTLTTSDLLDRR